jgi:hypothetical protein
MDSLVHASTNVINGLNWFAVHVIGQIPWEAIAASGILSGLLLIPQKLIKKAVDDAEKVAVLPFIKLNREQIMIVLVGLAGLTASAIHYLVSTPTANPSLVALQGLAVSFGTQPFYFLIVKPLSAYIAEQVTKAAAVDNDITSAKVPEGGLNSIQ